MEQTKCAQKDAEAGWTKYANSIRLAMRVEHVSGVQSNDMRERLLRSMGIVRAKAHIGLKNLATTCAADLSRGSGKKGLSENGREREKTASAGAENRTETTLYDEKTPELKGKMRSYPQS